jgi:hypothetical protein
MLVCSVELQCTGCARKAEMHVIIPLMTTKVTKSTAKEPWTWFLNCEGDEQENIRLHCRFSKIRNWKIVTMQAS